ncbi:RabGAP/TBC, partial [Basidiobolus meristosporus CBS 931.73]
VDATYWEDLASNFEQRYKETPELVRASLYQGIPPTFRGRLWKIMSKGDHTFLETLYSQLVDEPSPHDWNISLDIPRTFPRLEMFQDKDGPGQTGMRNVLRVYSTYDAEVGYCQGFGHIVGILLMQLEECEAFCVFVRMMESYELRTTYLHNMIGLELRIYQLRSLMSTILPNLLSHLDAFNIKTGMYSTQWFLTIFGSCFPLQLVQRIYDVMFIDGVDVTLLRVALALLKRNEARILQLNQFEDIITVLSTRLCEPY